MFKQALRMTLRDWRAGQLRFLLVALVVAVAALSASGFFIDRMRSGLNRDAHQLLGGDLVVQADLPIRAAWRAEAQRRGLLMAETVVFPSMAQAGEGDASLSQLASIKAVGAGYPLRGKLKLTTDPLQASDAIGAPASGIPAAGTVWIDAGVLPALQVNVGDAVRLGDKVFTVAQLIAAEPDRGTSFVNFAPRVMLAQSDLAATNLVQPGSRVTYRLLLAAPSDQRMGEVRAFEQWLRARIEAETIKGVRIESLEALEARDMMRWNERDCTTEQRAEPTHESSIPAATALRSSQLYADEMRHEL